MLSVRNVNRLLCFVKGWSMWKKNWRKGRALCQPRKMLKTG